MTLASAAILASASESAGNTVVVLLLIAFALAGVILFLAAVVSVLRSHTYASGGKAVWVLIMLAFPLVGPLSWFIWGRKSTMTNPRSTVL